MEHIHIPAKEGGRYGEHKRLTIITDTIQQAINIAVTEYPTAYVNSCNDGGHVTHFGVRRIEDVWQHSV